MTSLRIIAAFAVTSGCWLLGGATQYDSCINGTIADIGNGRCDAALNIPSCGYDGGDCCPCTCSDGPDYACSDNNFDCLYPGCDEPEEETNCALEYIADGYCDHSVNNNIGCSWDGGDCCEASCVSGPFECGVTNYWCLDPAFFDPGLVAEYPDCTGNWNYMGDGSCDQSNNNALCGYDGGDCCLCSCTGFTCSFGACLDPAAGDPLYDCAEKPPAATLPCSAQVQQQLWTVENSEQAQDLAAAVNCSGGSFEVEWRGRVVVGEAIYVADGTVLTVTGAADTGAVIDGNGASRLFTVADAALHLQDLNITSGTSLVGGAIAATASVLTFNRTNFIGNSATGVGGAVFLSEGSILSCGGGVTLAYNSADMSGGAMFVAGASTVLCGSSWINNTAGNFGGALSVVDGSTVSWMDEATFSFNTAALGGALTARNGTNVSWSGATSFFSNSAAGFGGAVYTWASTVSWSGPTMFVNSVAQGGGGGAFYTEWSDVSWSATSTQFVANSAGVSGGGAIFTHNRSSISWTGTTEFTSNTAPANGGAVGATLDYADEGFLESTVVLNGPTTFSNNYCAKSGGALALLGSLSLEIGAEDVSFINNTATVSGGAIYISSMGIGQIFHGVSFVSNSAQAGGAVSSVASGNLLTAGSANPTTFERCLFVDNRATATGGAVESAGGLDSVVSSVFEGNKAGTGGALRLAGTANIVNSSFVDNVSDDGEGTAVSNIGSLLMMENISFNGNVFDCQQNMYLGYGEADDPYETACSGCETTCDGCTFDDPPVVPVCKPALEHTSSAGGTVTLKEITIDYGYWRATESSANILACYHADACLGGVTGAAGYCLEGYEGPYCSICSDGYTPELGFICMKCSDSARGVALAAALVVVALVMAAAVLSYLVSGKGAGSRRGIVERVARYIPLQSVKIVVVAWQILTQFSSVANVTYPDAYQRFVDALDVFNFDLTWILSAACVVDVDFHDRLLMVTIGPMIAMLFLAGTYFVAARFHRGAPESLQIVWTKFVTMVLLLTFLVYSSVSSVLFMSWACEDLDDGKTYLRADYRIECNSSKHKAVQVYAGFMVVFYTAGIPAFYGALLFRDREVLRREIVDREEETSARSSYELWKPYKPSVFYYEVIECGRRILLAGVVVFIYPNTAAQIAMTLLMAFVFVVVSEALAPYASRWDAWLNRIGHGVVYVSMFVALLEKVDVSDERASGRKIFEALLVTAHVCLILVVVIETFLLACVNFPCRSVLPQRVKVAPGGPSSRNVSG